MYKISMIMPIYNGEKFLKKSIESLIKQSIGFENIELLLINDNSKDNSQQVIEEYENKYQNCKVFKLKKNSGYPGKPRNIGIKNSNSDYIMFMDQDDSYEPNTCEILYNKISIENADIVSCRHKNKNKDKISTDKIPISQKEEELIFKPASFPEIFVSTSIWNTIYSKDLINKYNINFPEKYLCEDLIFILKTLLNADKMIFLNKYYGYIYNIRESNDDKSTIREMTPKKLFNLLKGYEEFFDILSKYKNENQKRDILNVVFEVHITSILNYFVKINANINTKIDILNKIYSLENRLDYKINLKEKWAKILNYTILKKKFKLTIFLSKIIKFFTKFGIFIRIYRKTKILNLE